MTMLEKVAFISFLSFSTAWFGYNFVANGDELKELDQTLQWSCKSDRLDMLQPNCPWQTVNLAFIKHISIHRHFYYVHLFLENSSIFSHYFFHRMFFVLLGQLIIQKNVTISQFKDLC